MSEIFPGRQTLGHRPQLPAGTQSSYFNLIWSCRWSYVFTTFWPWVLWSWNGIKIILRVCLNKSLARAEKKYPEMLIKSRVTSSVNRLLSMGKKTTMCNTSLVILQITFPNLNETWQAIKTSDNQLLYASYKSFQATLCVFRHSRMCWRVWCASWASAEAGKPGREAGNIF